MIFLTYVSILGKGLCIILSHDSIICTNKTIIISGFPKVFKKRQKISTYLFHRMGKYFNIKNVATVFPFYHLK
jgi:hypothetical protein